MEQIKNEANALFMALPSNHLEDLYDRLMDTPEFPLHDRADDSVKGRVFWVATTVDHEHANALNLIESLRGFEFSEAELDIMYRIYRDTIREMNAEMLPLEIRSQAIPHVPPPAVFIPEIFPEENKINEFADRFKCSICLENAVNTRLNPCGHLLCNACFNFLPVHKQCPICRRDVVDDQHIFYGGAKEKYLKYKSKYLALKNKLKN